LNPLALVTTYFTVTDSFIAIRAWRGCSWWIRGSRRLTVERRQCIEDRKIKNRVAREGKIFCNEIESLEVHVEQFEKYLDE
jgi:hypothetical protein